MLRPASIKKVSDYVQEILQSQTADKPMAMQGKPHNNHETPARQTKQSNQLFLPHQDHCKLEWTQSNEQQIIEPHWE